MTIKIFKDVFIYIFIYIYKVLLFLPCFFLSSSLKWFLSFFILCLHYSFFPCCCIIFSIIIFFSFIQQLSLLLQQFFFSLYCCILLFTSSLSWDIPIKILKRKLIQILFTKLTLFQLPNFTSTSPLNPKNRTTYFNQQQPVLLCYTNQYTSAAPTSTPPL